MNKETCTHGHENQKCNICRDRFEVRIVEEGRSIKKMMVQMTRNGFSWQSIGCDNKKELVWQGMGTGYLSRNMDKKEERIKEFVSEIMKKYPPGMVK